MNKQICISMESSLATAGKNIAETHGQTFSSLLALLLKQYLANSSEAKNDRK